jgi:hypothetical protein
MYNDNNSPYSDSHYGSESNTEPCNGAPSNADNRFLLVLKTPLIKEDM